MDRFLCLKFSIPDIRTNIGGFSHLLALAEMQETCSYEKIELDFSDCNWFDANMSSPLGAILARASNRLNQISIMNVNEDVSKILCKNTFLTTYGFPELKDWNSTVIPYRRFKTDDYRLFGVYLNRYLKNSKLPAMTEDFSKKFFGQIHEVFSNASVHSETLVGIFSCGQFFPAKNKIEITIADAGIGIRNKINKEKKVDLSPAEAIAWALEKGNTTRKESIPGGLGLKLLKNFIQSNKGKLIIVSDKGYWEFSENNESSHVFSHRFPGTAVTLEINTADTKKYGLSSSE